MNKNKKITTRQKTKIKLLKIIFLFLSASCVGVILQPSSISASHMHRVLYISSYHPAFPTFFQQIEGVQEVFSSKNIELDIEFMDSKRFYTETNLSQFYDSIRYKISEVGTYDAIIVADDNALNFALDNQADLFPDTPVVFLGVNNVDLGIAQNENPLVTGVLEAISMTDTISLTQRVNPNLSKLYVIVDATPSGQGDLETFEESIAEFPNIDYEILSLKELTFSEFSGLLDAITRQDAVLLLSAFRDRSDQTLDFDDSLDLIVNHLDAPLYHLYYHGMGDGVLGGKLISHYEQGKTAASLVLDILEDGRPVRSMPVITESPNQYVFDFNVLQQFDVDMSLLPEDSIIENEPVTFYYQYREIVWGVTAVIATLSFIIIISIYIIRRQQKAERKLRTSESQLRANQTRLETALNELKVVQDQLVQQERLAAVGQLSAGIAHDFNNILASILLYSQLMQSETNGANQTSKRLDIIIQQCNRAGNLVQQILDFGRRSMLEVKLVDLVPFMTEVYSLLRRLLPENIEIRFHSDEANCVVEADLTRIQQVVLNLAFNARDAMPDGGELLINVSKTNHQATYRCSVCGLIFQGDMCVISLTDTGEGIPDELQAKIFEPFFTTKAPLGSGLGLSQVYGIMEQHSGHVLFESEVGLGTKFSLFFPVSDVPIVPLVGASPPNIEMSENKELILVVEDNEVVRRALIENLHFLGYRTVEAANGEAALPIIKRLKNEIALIISDFVMPLMGGDELYEAVQQLDYSIGFIILSGHSLNNNPLKLEKNITYLTKPVKIKDLAQEVSSLLTGSKINSVKL